MSDEKTEEPTEEKLRKSKKKGEVPQTKNQVTAITLITGPILVYAIWPIFKDPFLRIVDLSFSNLTVSPYQKLVLAAEIAEEIFLVNLGIIFMAMSIIVFFSTLLLSRFTASMESMKPKISKLNPVSGVKNIFKLKSLYTIFYTLVMMVAFSISLCFVLMLYLQDFVNAYDCNEKCLFMLLDINLITMMAIISLLLVIFSLLDIMFQKKLFLKDQKMSKDEVKRENKEMGGSPEIIGKRKEIANEMVFGFDPKEVTLIVYGGEVALAYIYGGGPNDYPFLYKKVVGSGAAQLKDHYANLGKKVEYSGRIANRFAAKNENENYLPEDLFEEFATLAQKHDLIKQ